MSVLFYVSTTFFLTKYLNKKTRYELHVNAACYFEQILEVAPYKTTVVQSLSISQTIQVR